MKRSVSVRAKHLLVTTGICQSSRGSGIQVFCFSWEVVNEHGLMSVHLSVRSLGSPAVFQAHSLSLVYICYIKRSDVPFHIFVDQHLHLLLQYIFYILRLVELMMK